MNNKSKKRVLVVDDSELTRHYYVYILKDNGFLTEESVDGADALEKLYKLYDIGLIITDINMPNMDGYTLIKKIRENEDFNDIPIIVISTEKIENTKETALELGADYILEKPIKSNELLDVIGKLLNY